VIGMVFPHRQHGGALVAFAALLLVTLAAALTTALARSATGPHRDRISDRALATAREALIAYAAGRAIDEVVGPGYLPCPDLDDDGWAESTCGSLSGEVGQSQRLGRLPWKTLGLPDLRDGHGERLWYAVSTKYKGLLNCAASSACVDMNPDALLGTITVRDPTGAVAHDGRSANLLEPDRGGAVAVVIAPGAPLERWEDAGGISRTMQERSCAGGRCNAAGHCLTDPPSLTAKCNPVNYLDRAPGPAPREEDNARFVDRSDNRSGNGDGFIRGPVVSGDGVLHVNDRLAVISYNDLVPRIMGRVAQEVAQCLRRYAARPESAGRYPWPAPLCRSADPDPALRWADATGVLFGRIPDTPFAATRADSGDRMLDHWPAVADACHIADAAGRTSGRGAFTWWSAWKRFVFYALAANRRPAAAAMPLPCDSAGCLQVIDDGQGSAAADRLFAVIVAGAPLATASVTQSHGPLADLDARNWLEDANAELRGLNANPAAPGCAVDASFARGAALPGSNRIALGRTSARNDVVLAQP
jgi:hypothetical protein